MLTCFQGLRRPLPHELVLKGFSLPFLLQSHVRDNPQSLTGGDGGGGGEAKELRGGRDQLKMKRRKGREGVDYLAGDRWEAKGDAAPGGGWEGEEEEGGRGLEDVSKSKHRSIRSSPVRQVTQGRITGAR
jgi:hypothetical protein